MKVYASGGKKQVKKQKKEHRRQELTRLRRDSKAGIRKSGYQVVGIRLSGNQVMGIRLSGNQAGGDAGGV